MSPGYSAPGTAGPGPTTRTCLGGRPTWAVGVFRTCYATSRTFGRPKGTRTRGCSTCSSYWTRWPTRNTCFRPNNGYGGAAFTFSTGLLPRCGSGAFRFASASSTRVTSDSRRTWYGPTRLAFRSRRSRTCRHSYGSSSYSSPTGCGFASGRSYYESTTTGRSFRFPSAGTQGSSACGTCRALLRTPLALAFTLTRTNRGTGFRTGRRSTRLGRTRVGYGLPRRYV